MLQRPLTIEESGRIVESWFHARTVRLISPGSGHVAALVSCLKAAGAGSSLTTDAHIASLAIEYQAEVHSSDLDFGRFPGVRWKNPLRD